MTGNIKNKSLLVFLAVALLSIAMPACNKDKDEMTTTAVKLLSFGPAGAKPGEEIRFIGHNLNKVTAIAFAGVNAVVDKSAFTSQSSELITLVVPQSAERGRVTLNTSDGDIVSKTMFDLGIGATVTSFTQEAKPGTSITITGTFLNWVTAVTFTDDKVVSEFVSQSFDELVVTVPDSAKTGPLLIAYSGTEAGDFETEQILNVTLPQVTSIDPALVKHEDNITLKGTDLDLVKKIYFNSVAEAVTEFVSQSATELTVKVPGGTTKGAVKVEAASGVQTQSPADLDIILPIVTAIAPAAVKNGENITITGSNMDLAKSVYFSNVDDPVTTFVSQSATQLVVKVPAGAKKGKVKIGVASGVLSESAMELDIILPVITSIEPNPVAPGSQLTINGTNLNLATSVILENVPAIPQTSFVSQSATKIVVVVPAGTANGKVRLGVVNATLIAESAGILEISGSAPPPQINSHIYDDQMENGFQKWGGWGNGNAVDIDNASPVRVGNKSIKVVNGDAWGAALQLGNGTLDFGAYTVFKFSVYCTPDAVGKRVSVRLIDPYLPSDSDGNVNAYTFTFGEAGKWHDVSIPLSAFSKAGTAKGVKEISFQQMDANFTVYLDEIGFN